MGKELMKSKTALIIHGAFGSPEENWIPWLKKKLNERGYEVITPIFPTPEIQSLNEWNKVISPHLSELASESIIVGHSIGAVFALSVLEQLETPVKATALVSGFLNDLGNETFDSINRSFYQKDFVWEQILKNTGNISVLHGNNDPYVPVAQAELLADKLNTKAIIIENGGHLNTDAGFDTFPKLIDVLL